MSRARLCQILESVRLSLNQFSYGSKCQVKPVCKPRSELKRRLDQPIADCTEAKSVFYSVYKSAVFQM